MTRRELSIFKKFCLKLKKKIRTQSNKHKRLIRKLKQKHNISDYSYDFVEYENLNDEIEQQKKIEQIYSNMKIPRKYFNNVETSTK